MAGLPAAHRPGEPQLRGHSPAAAQQAAALLARTCNRPAVKRCMLLHVYAPVRHSTASRQQTLALEDTHALIMAGHAAGLCSLLMGALHCSSFTPAAPAPLVQAQALMELLLERQEDEIMGLGQEQAGAGGAGDGGEGGSGGDDDGSRRTFQAWSAMVFAGRKVVPLLSSTRQCGRC